MNDQLSFFYEVPDRKVLLKNAFQEGFFIPSGEIDKNFGWGIGNTTYIEGNDNWIFGFLHKTVDASNVSTIPPNATSLDQAKQLEENLLNKGTMS